MVEQLTLNQRVAGSSPASPTIFLPVTMKEIPAMARHFPNRFNKMLVSVIVLIEQPLSSSSAILNLLKSNYPLSNIEVFFAGKTANLQKNEGYKQFESRVKAVKIVPIKSSESVYSEVFPLIHGEIGLFTSGDCFPDTNWIKRMMQTFSKDDLVGMVLGGIQQRRVNSFNKVEQYCEQIGWGSTSEISGDENDYINSSKVQVLEDENIYRAIPLLKSVNLGIRKSLLIKLPKSFMVLDILEKLRDAKLKFSYNPDAEVERFHPMDFKELDYEIDKGSHEKVSWLSRNPKNIHVQVRFFREWKYSMPFWISVNVFWGDFHWLNLFGIWILIECFTKGFLEHFGEGFWFADEVLLLISAFGFFSFKYFLPVLKIQPWSDFILWCWIRYRTNMSMFLSGLWAGLKIKCFYWGESW